MIISIVYGLGISMFLAIVFAAGWSLSVGPYTGLPDFTPLQVLGIALIIYVGRNILGPTVRNIIVPPVVRDIPRGRIGEGGE